MSFASHPRDTPSHPSISTLCVLPILVSSVILDVKQMPSAFHKPPLPILSPTRNPLCNPPICCNASPPVKVRRLSLPTYRERRYLSDKCIGRAKSRRAFTRASAFAFSVWPLVVRDLSPEAAERRAKWHRRQLGLQTPREAKDEWEDSQDSEYDMPLTVGEDSLFADAEGILSKEEELLKWPRYVDVEIPPWAYVVRVQAGKTSIGKRAVQRNRAKRRIRAAANFICPQHAARGKEYVFSANPESLTIAYEDLVEEIILALKKTGCWVEEATLDMVKRERYCKW